MWSLFVDVLLGWYFLGIWELADLSTVPRFSLSASYSWCWPGERTEVTNDARRQRPTFTSKRAAGGDCAAIGEPRTISPAATPTLTQTIQFVFHLLSLRCVLFCSCVYSYYLPYRLFQQRPSRQPLGAPHFPGPYFLPFSVVLTHSVNITQTTLRFKVNVAAPRNEKLIESPFIKLSRRWDTLKL